MKSRRVSQVLLIGALLAGGPALTFAQGPAPASPPAKPQTQEGVDELVVRTAMDALARRGFGALRPYMTQLAEVTNHAPQSYPRVSTKDGVTTVRVMESVSDPGQASAARTKAGKDGAKPVVRTTFNTYGAAYFLRGAFALENRLPDAAVQELDKGLALQPDNVEMIAEKGSALSLLKKWPEMLALYEDALSHDWAFVTDDQKARMLRGKGAALTQLGRLDDSEAAYNQSLVAAPGNQNAQDGLNYIAALRAGGPIVPPELTSPARPRPPAVRPAPAPVQEDKPRQQPA